MVEPGLRRQHAQRQHRDRGGVHRDRPAGQVPSAPPPPEGLLHQVVGQPAQHPDGHHAHRHGRRGEAAEVAAGHDDHREVPQVDRVGPVAHDLHRPQRQPPRHPRVRPTGQRPGEQQHHTLPPPVAQPAVHRSDDRSGRHVGGSDQARGPVPAAVLPHQQHQTERRHRQRQPRHEPRQAEQRGTRQRQDPPVRRSHPAPSLAARLRDRRLPAGLVGGGVGGGAGASCGRGLAGALPRRSLGVGSERASTGSGPGGGLGSRRLVWALGWRTILRFCVLGPGFCVGASYRWICNRRSASAVDDPPIEG